MKVEQCTVNDDLVTYTLNNGDTVTITICELLEKKLLLEEVIELWQSYEMARLKPRQKELVKTLIGLGWKEVFTVKGCVVYNFENTEIKVPYKPFPGWNDIMLESESIIAKLQKV